MASTPDGSAPTPDPLTGGLARDTISAIATGPGEGGIGVIRLSGPRAYDIAVAISGSELKPRYAHYRPFIGVNGEPIDDGICLFFAAPHSFTGEDVVELQGHGGPLVLQMVQERCLELGARQAEPGEFSERAFLNNRLDLVQAEAIADLIAARTRSAARQAQATLRGAFSEAVDALSRELVGLRVYVEAAIDFPEEEIDFLADGQVAARLSNTIEMARELLADAERGATIRNGAVVVLAGEPNAGKSSLLNRLAGRDIAIVTDIPGTTRDVVREDIQINGIPLRISDTAGLRDTQDVVEQEGVRRANQEITDADLVLHVVDDADPRSSPPLETSTPAIRVLTKIDISGRAAGCTSARDTEEVAVSSVSGDGIDALRDKISNRLGIGAEQTTQFSARERHLQALRKTIEMLCAANQAFLASGAGELLAEDLRLCHDELGLITGRMTSDALLGEIFSSFCIGK